MKSEVECVPESRVIESYRDLKVWERAMELVTESYKLTKLLPRTEIYGLSSQIQRSAVSIPANIAEGHGREHLGDYLRHLSIARGSLAELETHLLIANRLALIRETELDPVLALADEVSRMLSGLTRKLKTLAPRT
jgi:four helix bundle protein